MNRFFFLYLFLFLHTVSYAQTDIFKKKIIDELIDFSNSENIDLKIKNLALYSDQDFIKDGRETFPNMELKRIGNLCLLKTDTLELSISINKDEFLDGTTLFKENNDTLVYANYENGKLLSYKAFENGKLLFSKLLKDNLYFIMFPVEDTFYKYHQQAFYSNRIEIVSNIEAELIEISFIDSLNIIRAKIDYINNKSFWYNEKALLIEQYENKILEPQFKYNGQNNNGNFSTMQAYLFDLKKYEFIQVSQEVKIEKYNDDGKIIDLTIFNKDNIEDSFYEMEYFYDEKGIIKRESISTKEKSITRVFDYDSSISYEDIILKDSNSETIEDIELEK